MVLVVVIVLVVGAVVVALELDDVVELCETEVVVVIVLGEVGDWLVVVDVEPEEVVET
jgi:hypothetical protein